MRIDSTQRRWCLAAAFIAAGSAVVYILYASRAADGPKGGSWIGLTFGIASALLILFCALLAVRKKILLPRVGSLTWWMKGHLWLGLLTIPLALFHSAFHFGGLLSSVLMWLLFIVTGTGIIGMVLQHVTPGIMTSQLDKETTYELIPHYIQELRREALELVMAACGAFAAANNEKKLLETAMKTALREPQPPKEVSGRDLLQHFYEYTVLPFLQRPFARNFALADPVQAAILLEGLQTRVDPALHDTVQRFGLIGEEVRRMMRQFRLHQFLHGWLLVHVPLSYSLLILLVVHAVVALYY